MSLRHQFAGRGIILLAVVVIVQIGSSAGAVAWADPATPIHLRVVTKSTTTSEPFVFHTGDRYTGFSIDLLDQLAKRVPFTYDIHGVPAVAQQLQEVQQGTADLAIASISITSSREKTLDFSYPIYNSGLQVMTSTNGPKAHRSIIELSFIRLFRPFLLVLGLILIVAHLAWLIESRTTDDFPRTYLKGVGEGLWWAAVTLTTVGYGDRTPRSRWGRVLAVFWMLIAIVVLANLTATITTAFTVQQLKSGINGPNDLGGRKVVTIRGTTAATYVEGRGLSRIEVATTDEAYHVLEDHSADALVYDAPVLEYYAEHNGKGAVQVVGSIFEPQEYGIAMPLGSPYRKAINEAILAVFEDGTYARLQSAWFGNG